jgi:hypothetical protein
MSAHYAKPGSVPLEGTEQQGLAPVLVAFAGPAPQSRLTVLFRVFMVIPQAIVLEILGIAAYVIAIIGWFGALFTGRLPDFAANFLTGFLRWQTRVSAYTVLLTDVYPPFSMEDADYPVRLAVRPGQLNRLAVLFRFFLLIPCWVVLGLLSYGAFTLVQFVSWVIVLITGRMPASLYLALAAALRYQVRVSAFGLMLTSAYPADLFGDTQMSRSWSPALPPLGGYGVPDGFAGEQGSQPVPDEEPTWRLVLSSGARKLMVVFLVLGVLFAAANITIELFVVNTVSTAASASDQVQKDLVPVVEVIDNYSTNLNACKGKLACAQLLDRTVATTLNTFAAQIAAIKMPAGQATSAAAALRSTTLKSASIFSRLASAATPTAYINIANSSGLDQSVTAIDTKYDSLETALGAS